MKMLIYFICLFVFKTINTEEQIKFVFSAIRHGARVPRGLDQNNIDLLGFKWDRKEDELTNVGMRQSYVLALRYREQYGSKMNILDNPEREDLLFLTSYTNRTLQSQLSFYQGFYEKGTTLTESQKEKAFPPFKLSDDIMQKSKSDATIGNFLSIYPFTEVEKTSGYFFTDKNCKNITEFIETEALENIIKDLWTKRGDILKAKVKYDETKPIKSRKDLLNYADTYIANYYNGNDLTKITNDVFALYNDLQSYKSKDYTYKTMENNYYIARVTVTKMIGNLIKYLEYRSSNDDNKYTYTNPKIVLNIFHDTNISEFIGLLNYLYKKDTDLHKTKLENYSYCSFFDFQLIKKDDKYIVRVIFNDEIILEKDLEDFISKLKSALIKDEEYNSFCFNPVVKTDEENTNSISTGQIVTVSLLGLLMILLISYIIYSLKKADADNTENALVSDML